MEAVLSYLVGQEGTVQRSVSLTIIPFDVVAVIIWIAALIYNKQKRALIFCVIGFCVYYFVDAIVWMAIMNKRQITAPFNPFIVQIWLQLGPGLIHPSFVCMMYEGTFGPNRKNVRRELWFLLFILVQFVPAFMQAAFPTDEKIQILRTMNSQRWAFILIAVLGYLYLVFKRVSVSSLIKLFIICTTVEAGFELSLVLSEIRIASFTTVLVDCIIEFNVGAGLTIVLWRLMISKEDRKLMDFGPGAFSLSKTNTEPVEPCSKEIDV